MWRNTIENAEFQKNLNRKAPAFANINLLGKCNVDCYFCLGKDLEGVFSKFSHNTKHFNEWPNFEAFLKGVQEASIKNVYVTGQNTDALMYKYIGELIDFLQNRGFDAGLRTNGYLAPWYIGTLNSCRRNVGLSIHSLNPETNWEIMRRKDIPDWGSIIPAIKNVRVSIVLNRHNEAEFPDLLKYISGFENVKYIQVRRICTDTRESYLLPDVEAYERVFQEYDKKYPIHSYFYAAQQYEIHGKLVCFWRTVKTEIDSHNYYTDGTINREYFVIEGYMRDSENQPRIDGVPQRVETVEGYWREKT